jgi:hypothetical protein
MGLNEAGEYTLRITMGDRELARETFVVEDPSTFVGTIDGEVV